MRICWERRQTALYISHCEAGDTDGVFSCTQPDERDRGGKRRPHDWRGIRGSEPPRTSFSVVRSTTSRCIGLRTVGWIRRRPWSDFDFRLSSPAVSVAWNAMLATPSLCPGPVSHQDFEQREGASCSFGSFVHLFAETNQVVLKLFRPSWFVSSCYSTPCGILAYNSWNASTLLSKR
jgi:hypothetical protein